MIPTGEPYTDALALLDMSSAERAEFYCAMHCLPAEYRSETFAAYDEMVAAEKDRQMRGG